MRLMLHASLFVIALLAASCGPEPAANTGSVSPSPLAVTPETPEPAAIEIATILPTFTPIPVVALPDDYSPLPTPTTTWTPMPTPTAGELRQILESSAPPGLLELLEETEATSSAELINALEPLLVSLQTETGESAGYCRLQATPIDGSDLAGVSAIRLEWWVENPMPGLCLGHSALIWRVENGAIWHAQPAPWPVYSTVHVQDGRLARGYDATELTTILEWCRSESGKNCTWELWLHRLENGVWRYVSRSEIGWERVQYKARANFMGGGLDRIMIATTSVYHDDPKSQLFVEDYLGPHRVTIATWQREGDTYLMTDQYTESTAYNTLVEFLFALKTAGEPTLWTTCDELADEATRLGLETLPQRQEQLYYDRLDPSVLRGGPLTLDYGQDRVTFVFVQRDGQFLIDAIDVAP